MKKTKKLAALFLAMLMALSCMATTAMAYGAEEHDHDCVCSVETIQPRIPAQKCPKCGTTMNPHAYIDTNNQRVVEYFCPKAGCGGYLPPVPW